MFSLTVPSSLSQKVISLLNAVSLLSCVCTLARSTMLGVENGARNVTGVDGFVSLGKSSVTKKEF